MHQDNCNGRFGPNWSLLLLDLQVLFNLTLSECLIFRFNCRVKCVVLGGVVFMYVQCTMYMTLCRRWRAYNRIILVKDAPSRFGNTTTTTVTLTSDSNKANSVKRKGDKKSPAAPVQSVVTIASAFAGGNIRTKSSSSSSNHCAAVVEPDEAASSQHQLIDANHIINSESLHAEEMAALLDLKIHPSPSQRPPSVDPMPSIHNP